MTNPSDKEAVHVVVLGGGIGGISMAYDLRAACEHNDNQKITVISESETFHFVPSNPWVGVNWRKRKDIEVPLAPYLKKKDINFIPVAAKKLHPKNNMVELIDGQKIDYDYLVIATGPKLAFDAIEGLGPDGYTKSICHIDHAEPAGKDWEHFKNNTCGPIVVGAVQGASCFGPAYEYAFIMHRDLTKNKIRCDAPMTYVTSEPYIGHLGLGGVGDSKSMLESALRERGIKWICNANVDKIEDGTMFVTEMDDMGKPKKKHELPFAYSMMLPPFAGVDALQGIKGLLNDKGFVLVDEHYRNPTYKNIFSVGVCVALPPVEKTPVPVGTPKTGYMIESMVASVAHNIVDICKGNEPTHVPTLNTICLADMGNTGVAFVAIPQIPPRNVAWMRSGIWVHWMKHLFEWYFLRKVKKGNISPFYEKYGLRLMGIRKRKVQNK